MQSTRLIFGPTILISTTLLIAYIAFGQHSRPSSSIVYTMQPYTVEVTNKRIPTGYPKYAKTLLASVDLTRLHKDEVLFVSTTAGGIENSINSSLGLTAAVYLSKSKQAFENGDHQVLAVGAPNITNSGGAYAHYGAASVSGILTINRQMLDSGYRYLNYTIWIGSDDDKYKGKMANVGRARIDVLRFTPRTGE